MTFEKALAMIKGAPERAAKELFRVIHGCDQMSKRAFKAALDEARRTIIRIGRRDAPSRLGKNGKEEKREAQNKAERFRNNLGRFPLLSSRNGSRFLSPKRRFLPGFITVLDTNWIHESGYRKVHISPQTPYVVNRKLLSARVDAE